MAGNNSIQFLRGNNISGSDEELLPGQPAYDLTTKYLYVGDGSKISETSPIKASFADDADDAENVTSTINGKNISDIFETDGTTVKEATHAVSATEAETAENSPKSLYNLGAFDTYVDNGDGTVTVTRKTGKYDVPINDFVIDGNTCFQQNISLPNTDKYFIINGSQGSSDQATSNVYPLGAWGGDDTFYISSDNWLRVFDSSYSKDANGLAQFKASLEAAGGMYILYETDTSYPEKLPASVPINTLDANMSDIVRDEVEKTLNLFNGVWEQGTFNPDGSEIYTMSRVRSTKMRLGAGVYNLSLSGADEQNIYMFNNDGSIKQEIDWTEIGTFTLSESGIISIACRKSDNSDISLEDIQNTMLVKGTHAYPYQPYNGAIVHEKQLDKKEYLAAHNNSNGSWVKFAEITTPIHSSWGAVFVISQGYDSQATCILSWGARAGANGGEYSGYLNIIAGENLSTNVALADVDNGGSHTYSLYYNCGTGDTYVRFTVLHRGGNWYDNIIFPTVAIMQGEPSNIIQRASVLLPGGGTVYGNLSITGQLDFASLSTRAANALLSMVELSESPLQNKRVSWGGPNAAWSTNGSTWSHAGTIVALGYVTDLSTTGNVTSATYNSSTNRITYVISVNQNPGNNVYSGYVRYKYVIKEVK